MRKLGWLLDYRKFRIYLKEKYGVTRAYVFIGFLASNHGLYERLREAGFIIIFKPITRDTEGMIKGNVDGDLILNAMIEYEHYEKAVIVSGDGDFYSLAAHLRQKEKLEVVVSPNRKYCSRLLRQAAGGKIHFLDDMRHALAYQMKKHHPGTEP